MQNRTAETVAAKMLNVHHGAVGAEPFRHAQRGHDVGAGGGTGEEALLPGEAAGQRASAPFRFRYQYLAGGVNTGNGWATWNANGAFVLPSSMEFLVLIQKFSRTMAGNIEVSWSELSTPVSM